MMIFHGYHRKVNLLSEVIANAARAELTIESVALWIILCVNKVRVPKLKLNGWFVVHSLSK